MGKICLIGLGKMGQALLELAPKFGFSVVATIDPTHPLATSSSLSKDKVKDADIFIDFSQADAFLSNLSFLAPLKKKIVVGTTGWYPHLDQAKAIVEKEKIGFIYGENFSLGMLLFQKIVAYSAKLIDPFEEFDAAILEEHHRKKKDAPSGSANKLAEIFLKNSSRKKKIATTTTPEKEELMISSLRIGEKFGTHRVIFSSLFDTISLEHVASSSQGFASGALFAARWIADKQGFFHFSEIG